MKSALEQDRQIANILFWVAVGIVLFGTLAYFGLI